MINPKIIKLIYAYITQSYCFRIKHKHDDKKCKMYSRPRYIEEHIENQPENKIHYFENQITKP